MAGKSALDLPAFTNPSFAAIAWAEQYLMAHPIEAPIEPAPPYAMT